MIDILLNNIPLPTVHKTLEIVKENDAFGVGFSTATNKFPFLMIDNAITKQQLGNYNRFSKKSNVYNVQVKDGFTIYAGKLYVLEVQNGYRKCDIIYTNELLNHLTQPIHNYFTDFTVDGSTPKKYKEATSVYFEDNYWSGEVENISPRAFPETYYNYPTVKFPTQFTGNEQWSKYQGFLNHKILGVAPVNNKTTELVNQNVIVPFYYLGAPLFTIFRDTLGYTITGDFVNHPVFLNSMLDHNHNLLVEITQPEGDESEWKTVYKHHLTIEPKRFLPEWTVAEYIKNLQVHFNLKREINQITKTISLNFIESSYWQSNPVNVSNIKFTELFTPELNHQSSFIIEGADESKNFVNATLKNTSQNYTKNENTTVITTAFKAHPATRTKAYEEISGVGLFYYNFKVDGKHHLVEFPIDTAKNISNKIFGENGIYQNFHHKWIQFLLTTKPLTFNAICSERQKNLLENSLILYFLNQTFIYKNIEFKLTGKRYAVKLEVNTFVN